MIRRRFAVSLLLLAVGLTSICPGREANEIKQPRDGEITRDEELGIIKKIDAINPDNNLDLTKDSHLFVSRSKINGKLVLKLNKVVFIVLGKHGEVNSDKIELKDGSGNSSATCSLFQEKPDKVEILFKKPEMAIKIKSGKVDVFGKDYDFKKDSIYVFDENHKLIGEVKREVKKDR